MTSVTNNLSVPAERDELPRWDLGIVFPTIDSPEFTSGFDRIVQRVSDLEETFHRESIQARDSSPLDDKHRLLFEDLIKEYNALRDDVETTGSWLFGHVAVDSRDEAAEAWSSRLQGVTARLAKLGVRWDDWVASLDLEELLVRSPIATAHSYALQRSRETAAHHMSPEDETLVADLAASGISAWAKLYDTTASRVLAEVELDGEPRRLPITAIRNLAMSPERLVRERAFRAELLAWEGASVPIAAALNGIKGTVNTLSARRGWTTPLDEALFMNGMDRQTLDAMTGAARAAFPDLRRYLKAKATVLNLPALAWFDLFAPVGDPGRTWEWDEAVRFFDDQFGAYSDRLAGLMRRATAERWIDAGPRVGKSGGAFCMWLRDGDSRILQNFTDSYDGVSTLAHEMGHAYHNLNQRGLTPMQRETPMTLAETASTFCETIVREGALANADKAGQLFIIEQSLQGSCQIVVDILSRFDFETAVFERRRDRDLTVTELREAMLAAQRGTYGDGLDPDVLHPYMWAVKGHYYMAGYSYYNYPYLFGLLFGLGLYARYREDPEQFRRDYDDLLAATGLADARTLAARWDIDLHQPAFWESSLDVIRADVDRFVRLTSADKTS